MVNLTYGGTGWESSNPECNFMFPGDTDPSFTDEWTKLLREVLLIEGFYSLWSIHS